ETSHGSAGPDVPCARGWRARALSRDNCQMSEPIRRMLVAYDISNDARRDRVAAALQEFGERVQYSVFMVDGRPATFVRLKSELRSLINPNADTVMFCDLGPRENAV